MEGPSGTPCPFPCDRLSSLFFTLFFIFLPYFFSFLLHSSLFYFAFRSTGCVAVVVALGAITSLPPTYIGNSYPKTVLDGDQVAGRFVEHFEFRHSATRISISLPHNLSDELESRRCLPSPVQS
ncbi:hypothetical protein F4819DRAFT_479707 [Hypoxylon fuscum]|nr:hypothetical protein F4819DRAFT_479707 [Hypoxylon fuscum]